MNKSEETAEKNSFLSFFSRKLDTREPEVSRAIIFSSIILGFIVIIDFCSIFLKNVGEVRALILALIGGLLGLLGISIAGIAIVISMFTSSDIKAINGLRPKSFEKVLKTFEYFALDIVLEILLFISIYLLMLSDIPAPPPIGFYLLCGFLVYSFSYILFYGWALLGNCLALSNIKCLVDDIAAEKKSKFEWLNEAAIEQLVEIIYRASKQPSDSFYTTLIQNILKSDLPNKEDLATYIDKRYLSRQ